MNKTKMYIGLAAIIVLILVVLFVEIPSTKNNGFIDSQVGKPVPQAVVAELSVPNSVSNKIGIGGVQYLPIKLNSTSRLMNGTKPEILYMGAEYCPYCAVTRWGLIIALSRFGTFSNLHYMASNSSDVYADTPTFDFYNSTYQSSYISFVSVEQTTRNRLQPLQNLTPSEVQIADAYNTGGGIPFIDFSNLSAQESAPILPSTLTGQTWNSTIANLTNTSSSISQGIVGSADLFTAEICLTTNNTPSDVCGQPYVGAIQKQLGYG